MDSLREQIVQFANAEFARGYLFGGTNNAEAPFSVDGDGRLLYNGIDIDSIYRDPADGLCYYDNALGDKTLVPENSEVFQDVGIGLTVSHGAAVDPRSAYRASFSGLDVLGFGKTTDGVSNNLFNLLKDASDVLRSENFDEDALKAIGDNIEEQRNILMSNIIDIGARSNFLDKTAERIEKDNDNLIALQQKIEVVDIPTETISWKTYTAVMEAIFSSGPRFCQYADGLSEIIICGSDKRGFAMMHFLKITSIPIKYQYMTQPARLVVNKFKALRARALRTPPKLR
jgi:flagellin-like hook-associated protein FlgL